MQDNSIFHKIYDFIGTHYQSVLWLLPFVCFISGFQIINKLSGPATNMTPQVLGLPIYKAIRILSDNSLNVRILKEKEDSIMPAGMVISQSPTSHEKIKRNQSVYLTVTKQPEAQPVGIFIGLTVEKAQIFSEQRGYTLKTYLVEHTAQPGTVIAQIPAPEVVPVDKIITVYVARSENKDRIMPTLTHMPVMEVLGFLQRYGITPHVRYAPGSRNLIDPTEGIVVDQSIPGGTVVSPDQAKALIITVS